MSQYLLSMYYAQSSPDDVPDDLPQIMERVEAFNGRLTAAGAFVWTGGLQPPNTARVVTARDDEEALVTDGPYLESHEAIGGFWVIEASTPDAAARWAEEASAALGLPVEVRPFG